MTFSNLTIGIAASVAILQLSITAVLPSPPPIYVHALYYDADLGKIVQDRTVTTDNGAAFFWAHWNAQIIETATNVVVCQGEGEWPYTVGRKAAELDIPVWVGDDDCALTPGQSYVARAAWLWGDDQEAKTSAPFVYQ